MERAAENMNRRLLRLERELVWWRTLGLIAGVSLTFAFSQAGEDKEIKFVSSDGRQTVVVSADGISLRSREKTLRVWGSTPSESRTNSRAR